MDSAAKNPRPVPGAAAREEFPFAHTLTHLVTEVLEGRDVDVRKLGGVLNFYDSTQWNDRDTLTALLGEDCLDNDQNASTRPTVSILVDPDPVTLGLVLNDPLSLLAQLGQEPIEPGTAAARDALDMQFDPDWGSAQQMAVASLLLHTQSRPDRWEHFDTLTTAILRLQPAWKTQAVLTGGRGDHDQKLVVMMFNVAYGRLAREDVKFPAA